MLLIGHHRTYLRYIPYSDKDGGFDQRPARSFVSDTFKRCYLDRNKDQHVKYKAAVYGSLNELCLTARELHFGR